MDSIFEEKPELSPVIGGWKQANENSELLATLLTASSLLQKHTHESYVFEKTPSNEFQKVYAVITNEVFYIAKSQQDKTIVKWMDLKFRRIEKIYEKNQVGLAIYGGKNKFEIFFTTEKSFKE